MPTNKRWWVVSDEYTTYYGGAYEPDEEGRDVVLVEAPTKRKAKVVGLRAMRADSSCRWHRQNTDLCPFSGLTVEEADDVDD